VADEEAVERLKQGVAEWNAWREAHRGPGANLSGADLTGANLIHAHLYNADLRVANLTGADLTSANLIHANLHNADLRVAKLSANLIHAHLYNADLRVANLTGANLTDVRLSETIFGNVDLTGVIGLETCRHNGPSTIDHRTLQRSGTLPLAFLRGVGLPVGGGDKQYILWRRPGERWPGRNAVSQPSGHSPVHAFR
jgi:uncharacterized protein YjbI with pentapeptide repeats